MAKRPQQTKQVRGDERHAPIVVGRAPVRNKLHLVQVQGGQPRGARMPDRHRYNRRRDGWRAQPE